MIDEIKEILELQKIHSWKINCKLLEQYQRYLIKDEVEDDIESLREIFKVTVYIKKGKKIGESTVTITGITEITEKIEEAIIAANFSLTKNWSLPLLNKFPKIKTADPYLVRAFELQTVSSDLDRLEKELIKTIKKEKNISLNSAEIRIKRTQYRVITSDGTNIFNEDTQFFIETAITAKNKDREMEFTPQYKCRKLEELNIADFIKNTCNNARDVLNSKKSPEFKGKILLSGDALKEFFVPAVAQANPYVLHASARMNYINVVNHKIGDIIAPKGLTLINDPTINYGLKSRPFDFDGLIATKSVFIKSGKLVNYYAQKKYADYMKIKATSPLGNMVIKLPIISYNKLYEGDYIKIVQFSWFSPDWLSGNFSSEIRLGYYCKDGKISSFKGGLFVGSMFNIEDMNGSKKQREDQGYYGPETICFTGHVASNQD